MLKKYLIIRNLCFSFKKKDHPFFENINAAFKLGTINFIHGKNGIGKSTLLRIIQGNIQEDEEVNGIFEIDGIPYDLKKASHIYKQVALGVQNFNTMLVDNYSFKENLQYSLMPHFPELKTLPTAKPIPKFVEKYCINYEVPISFLSGGQRQILSLLMILQQSPKILLLDEPTATLDEENAKLIMDFLNELCIQESLTIIAIVHNKEIIQKYCSGSYLELNKDRDGNRALHSTTHNNSYPWPCS